jgi:hypothetical protein
VAIVAGSVRRTIFAVEQSALGRCDHQAQKSSTQYAPPCLRPQASQDVPVLRSHGRQH